uniref:MIF4G domain-containing protein n=1 Tax=Bionectria ochroleuca TaxID=29856 RepID=A0A8H7K8J5_BIOOC
MTSSANQQNSVSATNNTATAVPSYASAAGVLKKSASQSPAVVTGSQPPVVVGSSASPAQNAKPASTSSLNGKSAVTPAIPAVARGSSASNGNHTRQSSVTMAANGPNSYISNGGPVGGAKSGIQFGFDSPAMAHSTPQTGSSAPIPIPGGNARVPSPAHSPSPIPQPSASGGRPPSGLQQPASQMTFGSLSSDGERHMRQGSVPPNPVALGGQQPGAHFRRESNHSVQSDHAGRGNFTPQAGRGRGFNPHSSSYNNQMGYPPNNQFRNGQGRGMAPSFQPSPRNMYPNSPQPNRSPLLVPSMPGTPNMPPANMQPNMSMQTPPQYHYAPPMPPQHQQNFGFPPQQLDQYGRPYGYNMPYMPPPQANSPGYNQTFVPPPYQQPGHSMSRTPSQPERPSSANQQAPAVAMGSSNKSTTPAQTNSAFVKPKKGAAIPIKSLSGEVLDTTSFKVPLSPALGIQHTKTPPVATSTPTPPPKSSTPGHSRTDSAAAPKTAKQIQDELKEKIKQATLASKNKEEKPAAPASPAPEPTPEAPKKEAEAPAKPTPAPAAAPEVPKKEEPVQEKEPEQPSAPAQETEEEEMERVIREMEEADAKREAEEEAHRVKREAEKAAEKQKAEQDRKANAADEDRKLREQEREMERLEEEKEKKRQEADKSGKAFSVADALAGKPAPKEAEGSKVDAVTDKLASMKLAGEKGDAKPTTAEKRGAKPAALNLAPLITKPVEPPQPSAALQSLKSARFLQIMDQEIYPAGIRSPNPALNAAVAKKGKTFKYDANFLMQFQKVFTEQPSLEFHQQVKSLIGDNDGSRSASGRGAQTPGSGRQSSRGGGGGFNMGAFNAPMRPAGSTSAERFQQATVGRGSIAPMNSFQRPGGAFPMSSGMGSRTPSQGSGMGPSSGSRTGSRANRNSRRPQDQSAKDAKTMPLTAGQEVKPIAVTSSGWKPTSIGRGAAGGAASSSTHLDPEMVQRKVKAALNKMTPDNFEKISDQILVIASQSKDETDGRTLRQVIQLTFEKATDEAHWASMYAKFCKKMLETMNPEIHDERIKDKNGNVVSGGNLFRKYLLNRCQEEFERGWQVNLPEPKESENKKPGEAVMLSDEYYTAAAAKRRGLGLVQFIGELYKLGMLTERIMLECVHKLVDHKGFRTRPRSSHYPSCCALLEPT